MDTTDKLILEVLAGQGDYLAAVDCSAFVAVGLTADAVQKRLDRLAASGHAELVDDTGWAILPAGLAVPDRPEAKPLRRRAARS